MWLLTQATDGEVKLLVQLLQVPTHQITHLHVLQVVPAPFISRIQVRGAPWQGLKPDFAVRARHELLDLRSEDAPHNRVLMHSVSVDFHGKYCLRAGQRGRYLSFCR